MRFSWRRVPGPASLRTRLLAGVLVPSALVLGVGSAVSIQTAVQAAEQQRKAVAYDAVVRDTAPFIPQLIAERGASLAYLADPSPANRARLDAARGAVDGQLQRVTASGFAFVEFLPPGVDPGSGIARGFAVLPEVRRRIDERAIPRLEVYQLMNSISDDFGVGSSELGAFAASSTSADRINRGGELIRVGDLVDRAGSLVASGLTAGDLSAAEYAEFVTARGTYLGMLDVLVAQLDGDEQQAIEALRAGADWQQLDQSMTALVEAGFVEGGEGAAALPATAVASLADTGRRVGDRFIELSVDRSVRTAERDAAAAQDTLRTSLITAGLLLIGLVAAFVVALTVTTRLVRRLSRLRRETLRLAGTVLPQAIDRVRKGERLDLDTEIPPADGQRDELGQVAGALRLAQRTAIEAAVEETATREGFNAAFLNIARRSQSILHQQMRALDRIERVVTDPDQLEMLFSVDHLATRERRNAENLIILGGEQPRRQWRNPVPLSELVRAAIGESEHYQRVSVGTMPSAMVSGAAVGDLVHLLAELVDNATAFSPPTAPVDVRGTVVGRGVAVEIEDQGLGLEDDELERLNALLAAPPDFGLFTLSRDSRIGLFVVARLAGRHQVRVNLRRSAYGGVRAGVLIPTAALATGSPPADSGPAPAPTLAGTRPTSTVELDAVRTRTPPITGPGDGRVAALMPARRSTPPPAYHQAGGGGHDVHRPTGVFDSGAGLAELPRRQRQTHMDARLLEPPPPEPDRHGSEGTLFDPPAASPERARSRMAALRRGSAQARLQDIGQDPTERPVT
jgi:hypothetical protein